MPTAESYILTIQGKGGETLVTIRNDGKVELHGKPEEAAEIFWACVTQKISQDTVYRKGFEAGVASVKGPLVS